MTEKEEFREALDLIKGYEDLIRKRANKKFQPQMNEYIHDISISTDDNDIRITYEVGHCSESELDYEYLSVDEIFMTDEEFDMYLKRKSND